MPVAPAAAVEEGCFNYYSQSSCRVPYQFARLPIFQAYSGIVNLLDYTSGSFPVTFADRSVDFETPDHVPLNPTDRAVWHTCE